MSWGALSVCGRAGQVGPSPRCQWLLSLLVVALAALALCSGGRAGPALPDPGAPGAPGATASRSADVTDCSSVLRRFGSTQAGYESGLRAHPTCDQEGQPILYDDYLEWIGLRYAAQQS